MRHEHDDAALLWDMLEAARKMKMQSFVAGKSFAEYAGDELLQAAVERKLEIIGEAARHVSEAFQAQHAEIPWRAIIAQRHVLAHEYGEIRQEKLWRVATVRVNELIDRLAPLTPPPPENDP